jgi:hypothetical protein
LEKTKRRRDRQEDSGGVEKEIRLKTANQFGHLIHIHPILEPLALASAPSRRSNCTDTQKPDV